ncbi:MAG: FtsQ-type POTRA domain-containing protein [Actinomycetota bacterium]|nr:MAG: FtsQ-type POTRA domain-containing protein [Actinomycetota bacterium]
MTATAEHGKSIRIDPRIRERRNKVARSQGRRRLYVIVAILVAMGGYFAVRAILRTSIFAVRQIEVTGSTHYSNSLLVAQSGIPIGYPLTEVNPALISQRMEQLSWIGPVTVRKEWPGRLKITVRERKVLAFIPESSASNLEVDNTGRVLATVRSGVGKSIKLCVMPDIASSKALVQSAACKAQATPVGSYVSGKLDPLLAIDAALHSTPVADFSELATSNSGEIDGVLANGVAVRFGSTAQLQQKLRALQLILSQASTAGYATIDLRSPLEPVLSNW